MPVQAIPFLLTTLSYLILGVWIVYDRRISLVQRLYGLLCLVTAVWQGLWLIMISTPDSGTLDSLPKLFYMVVVFVPSLFFHFVLVFSGQESRRAMKMVYALSALFAILVWCGNTMVSGVNSFTWGRAVRAGLLHPLFLVLVSVLAVQGWVHLLTMKRVAEENPDRVRRTRLVRLASIIYCGGALDLLTNYGVGFFPLSFIFTGAALVLIGLAIWRYNFLTLTGAIESIGERSQREAASQEMARLGMVAAFPMVSQGELLGYLLLGEKMSEEAYSKEDLLLLRIVANQAALGYQRVRYMEMAVYGARTEMLGEIAGGFAHEIKTPLANISLPAEMSLMDLDDVEKGTRPISDVLPELRTRMMEIMSQAKKASEKIEAVRQFSKPGQVRLEMVQLGTLVENSLALLAHLLKKSGVLVRLELPSVISPVRGDAKQLEIVFVNLIKNAVEAMAANPSTDAARELSLTAREQGEAIVITVKDTGPGIRRADFGNLFKAYFTTKGSQGTGIGLFLAQQVIKAHGGTIDVSSVEGQGTTFTLHLPRYQSPIKESRAA